MAMQKIKLNLQIRLFRSRKVYSIKDSHFWIYDLFQKKTAKSCLFLFLKACFYGWEKIVLKSVHKRGMIHL